MHKTFRQTSPNNQRRVCGNFHAQEFITSPINIVKTCGVVNHKMLLAHNMRKFRGTFSKL